MLYSYLKLDQLEYLIKSPDHLLTRTIVTEHHSFALTMPVLNPVYNTNRNYVIRLTLNESKHSFEKNNNIKLLSYEDYTFLYNYNIIYSDDVAAIDVAWKEEIYLKVKKLIDLTDLSIEVKYNKIWLR